MKNFKYFWGPLENPIFRRGLTKTNIEGELAKNGDLGQFVDLGGGGFERKRGGVFLRGWG